MFWLSDKNRFSWPWIIILVFSTLCLVGFDLTWRLVNISFVQLTIFGAIAWGVGVFLIFLFARALKKN